ncbi:MAG TPA: DUF3667 domain-containing protein [Rhizomicrobium sp.]|nr:DUF3667 domain-containing protein [Rhizomicrobium sp.]
MPDDLGAIAELGGAAAVEIAASALAERGAKTTKCRNCGAPVIGAYCAVCGQERDAHRRSLFKLLHDLFEEIVSFDSRVLRTVIALLFKPGELPLAFHEGRTRRYMPAVRLYLFVSLLFFLTLSVAGIALVQIQIKEVPKAYVVRMLPNGDAVIIAGGKASRPILAAEIRKALHRQGFNVGGTDAMKEGKASNSFTAQSISPGVHSGLEPDVSFFRPIAAHPPRITPAGWAQIEQMKTDVLRDVGNDKNGWMARNALATIEKLTRDPAALNGPLTIWIPRVFFLLLPLFACLLALFYVRQRKQFYFVDHLVFSLSVHSFVFAILIVAIGAAQLLPGGVVAWIILLSIGFYTFIALKRFYRQGWTATGLKFAAITFIYVVFVQAPALLFVLATGFIEG